MGLFSRFFGRLTPAIAASTLTPVVPLCNPATNPAYLDLLAHFAWAKADAFDLDADWADRLGDAPSNAVHRLIDAGMLRPAPTYVRLDRLFTVAELKAHLRAHGLGASGNKPALISRLSEHAPAEAEFLASKRDALELTLAGQALVDKRLTQLAVDRDAAIDEAAMMIRTRDYAGAVRCNTAFEAGHKVQLRISRDLRRAGAAMSIKDRRDQAAVLRMTAEARPKYLGGLSEEVWDDLRFAVAMDVMWGGGLAQWAASSVAAVGGRDWLVVRHAVHKRAKDIESRAGAASVGISRVSFGCCRDACESCKELSARTWPIGEAPELPHATCTNPRGCLCITKPILPNATRTA